MAIILLFVPTSYLFTLEYKINKPKIKKNKEMERMIWVKKYEIVKLFELLNPILKFLPEKF